MTYTGQMVHAQFKYVHPFTSKCPLLKNVHEYDIMREALLLLTRVTELFAALKLPSPTIKLVFASTLASKKLTLNISDECSTGCQNIYQQFCVSQCTNKDFSV